MRAMILAAGRGARMGELTAQTPKPLLKFAGKYLIEYSIEALLNINVRDIVINISYLGEQIKMALGDGSRYGARFYYSEETEALETGGGIVEALPLLGDEPFIVLSADVITDYPLHHLPTRLTRLAHLVLVDNPSFHPRGDFCLRDQVVCREEVNNFTFGNIGIYHPELFVGCFPQKFRLGDLLLQAITEGCVTGEHYQGMWYNMGAPQDLTLASTQSLINTSDAAL